MATGFYTAPLKVIQKLRGAKIEKKWKKWSITFSALALQRNYHYYKKYIILKTQPLSTRGYADQRNRGSCLWEKWNQNWCKYSDYTYVNISNKNHNFSFINLVHEV